MEYKKIGQEDEIINPLSNNNKLEKTTPMETNCALKAAIVTFGGGGKKI